MATQGMNPAYLLDPSLYGDQQAISQQQELAMMLMKQGISPMGDTQMAGNVALRNSPTQSMAKIAQLLSGQDMLRQSNQAGQAMMQRQSQAIMPMFQDQQSGLPQGQAAMAAGAAQGSVGPTNSNAQLAAQMPPPQSLPGPWTMPGQTGKQSLAAYLIDPEYGKKLTEAISPNETTKMAVQGGQDPRAANKAMLDQKTQGELYYKVKQAGGSDAQARAAVMDSVRKANYVAPNEMKAGNTATDPFTNLPKIGRAHV